MKRLLLGFESCLTVPTFIASWLVCAIGFSVVAGYRMAAAARDKKAEILGEIFKGGR